MKTYFVTGCNRGIGLGLARIILREGNRLIGTSRNPEAASLQELKHQYSDKAEFLALDVADLRAAAAVGKQLRRNTEIDVLINNAGINDAHDVKFSQLDLEVVAQVFRTNTLGAMALTQALIGIISQSPNSPIIANMSSVMGSLTHNQGGSYAYRISKSALNMFTRTLAFEYPGIICVALHPGWVKTDMGGADAPLSVETSVSGLYGVLNGLTQRQSGGIYDYLGNTVPW